MNVRYNKHIAFEPLRNIERIGRYAASASLSRIRKHRSGSIFESCRYPELRFVTHFDEKATISHHFLNIRSGIYKKTIWSSYKHKMSAENHRNNCDLLGMVARLSNIKIKRVPEINVEWMNLTDFSLNYHDKFNLPDHMVYSYIDMRIKMESIKKKRFEFHVGLFKGEIISTASIFLSKEKTGNIAGIYDVWVDVRFRGCGIGSNAINQMLTIARRQNVKYVILQSVPDAFMFFKKKNFSYTMPIQISPIP